MTMQDAEGRWFTAPTGRAQSAAVDELLTLIRGRDYAARRPATTALIELIHLTQHPGERTFLVRALGRSGDSFQAVPALHAETQHPDPAVRSAAFEGLGLLGIPFGGALVHRFFADRKLDDEPSIVLHAALLALARTSHPGVHETAESMWSAGRIRPESLHGILAEAHSTSCLDLAREHLDHSMAACAAALHLAAAGVADLEKALAPLRRHADPIRAQVAQALCAGLHGARQDDELLLEVMDARGTFFERARSARRLRQRDPEVLCASFLALTEGEEPAKFRGWCRNLLLAGIPGLQDAVLDFVAKGDPVALAGVIEQVSFPSPGLDPHLRRWLASDVTALARAAIRAAVNAYGAGALSRLTRFGTAKDPDLRHEYMRAIQNALRDQRDGRGRTTMLRTERAPWERALREGMRDSSEKVRFLAAFAAGNVGFTALTDTIESLLDPAQPDIVRQASATGLFELRAKDRLEKLSEAFLAETSEPVAFRLLLCLRRGLLAGEPATAVVREAIRRACASAHPRTAVLGVLLLGHCRRADDTRRLRDLAERGPQAIARAATASLGVLATDTAIFDLVTVAEHEDPARRMVAAEALGGTGNSLAADALLRLAMHEEDEAIRRAAVLGLCRCPLPAERAGTLQPRGAEDPLLLEILRARTAARVVEGGRKAPDLDATLERDIPGLSATRLERRRPDALRALRTAEYLSSASEVPAGLDASPPVIFWVKGLEIWLHEALAPVMTDLRQRTTAHGLHHVVPNWNRMRRELPDTWTSPPGMDTWPGLLKGLVDALEDRPDRVPSLRVSAAAVLTAGPLAEHLGLRRMRLRLEASEAQDLAQSLTALAALRNPLTHVEAGTPEHAAEARVLACAAGRLVAKLL